MIQMIKMEHCLIQKVELYIYDGVKDGRHFKAKSHLKSESQLITFFLIVFNNSCIRRI